MRKRVPCLILLAFVLCARPVSADPLRVTSGAFLLDIEGDIFSLKGQGFEIATTEFLISATKEFASECFFCAEGQLIDWSFRTTGSEQLLGRGTASVDGMSASNVDFLGSLRFTTVPTPLDSGGTSDFEFVAPFTFEAMIRGVRSGEQLFSHSFIGNGRVSVGYEASTMPGFFVEDDDTIPYEFADAAVPEPGTLLLLGSGMAAAALRRRRRA